MADRVKWNIEADYLQAWSCAYGCPCEFEAPPTHGFCEGLGAWQIERGHYRDVRLDGLGIGFSARWPGPLHEGNGTAVVFFDERANERQREALTQIVSEQAGGMPFELIVQLLSALVAYGSLVMTRPELLPVLEEARLGNPPLAERPLTAGLRPRRIMVPSIRMEDELVRTNPRRKSAWTRVAGTDGQGSERRRTPLVGAGFSFREGG